MSWTDERIELLRQLWQHGHSGSEIAERLGGISRNAVMGKISRLGLMGRSGSTKAKRRVRTHPAKEQQKERQPKPEPTKKAAKPAKRWANERTFVLRNLPRAERLEEAREVAAAYVPDEAPVDGGVPYGERKRHQCGEIVGPTSGDIRCCGKRVVDHEREVCAEHANRYRRGRPPKPLTVPSASNYLPRSKVA